LATMGTSPCKGRCELSAVLSAHSRESGNPVIGCAFVWQKLGPRVRGDERNISSNEISSSAGEDQCTRGRTAMHPISRAVMAAMAVLMVVTLVRAFRTGQISNDMATYTQDEQPFQFSIGIGVQVLGIAFFAWLASGGDAETFYRWILPR